MKGTKVVKNYLYNTSYEIIRLLAPLITTPYISRVLGASGIGAYSYTQSIATYFVLVGAVGTTLYGQREIAYVQKDKERCAETFWEIEIFRFLTSVICTLIFYLTFRNDPNYGNLYRILSLEVLATAFDISWFFIGMENFKVTVVRNILIRLIGIVLIFIFVKKPEDVQVYTLCVTVPIVVGNISLWFNMRKYLVKPSKDVLKNILPRIKPILILFLPQVAVEVYTVLDKTMIGIFGTDIDQVGYYTNAQKIIKIVLTVVTSLGTVMLPAMSAAFAEGKKDEILKGIKTGFRFVFMLAFALMFGIIGVASKFVPVFFGKGYNLVAPLMAIIAPIIIIIGMSNVIGKQYLLPTKQQGAYTISIIVGACINFGLNIILIRKYNAVGASIATVIAELGVTGVQAWCVRKQLPLGECLKPFCRYFVLGLVMMVAVYCTGMLLPDGLISVAIMILVGVIVYGAELIITKDEMIQLGLNIVRKRR